MRKKVLLMVLCVLAIILLKLICDYLLNIVLINGYKEEKYNAELAQLVAGLNFNKSYIANYNYGNVLYQKGEYENAIEQYKNALNTFVPDREECKIRINYALAICKTVNLDEEKEKDEASVNEAIKKYESAIDVLVEVECAHRDDNNGHNKDAQQLKNDIQKEIDRLKQSSTEQPSEDPSEDPTEEPNEENRTNENEITNMMEQIMEEVINTQIEQNIRHQPINIMTNRVEINW